MHHARESRPNFHFKPWNVGRILSWGLYALALGVAPLLWSSSFAQTMLSQIGIGIIVCLAYNILLGQGGMLSFGHAVYSGLGSYLAIHTLNKVGAGTLGLPVSLVPLVGGLGGLFFAAVLGWVTTKKSGTTFAMITLGVSELVWSMSLMIPEFFGGEGGVSANRVVGEKVLGISFGPQIQVYYLIAVYCFVCTAAMFALTRTPLGRILNAVRDNPERVEFIGYDTQKVRYLVFMISGFFSGIAGILGAVLMVIALVLLSELTKAWLLYLGLVFLLMVMYATGGLASLIMMNVRVAKFGKLRQIWTSYLGLGVTALVMLAGAGAMIEMVYHLQLNSALGDVVRFMGIPLNAKGVDSWVGAAFLLLTGIGLFELARRQYVLEWGEIQAEIEKEIKRRETAV